MAKQRVMIKAPFADFSGYATVARHLLLELVKLDVFDLYLEPIVWINSGNLDLPAADTAVIDRLLEKSKTLNSTNVTDVILLHFTIATEFVGKQNSPFKRNIGFTMLETDKTSPTWAQRCNMMDAVIVPSNFCLSSFMQSNITVPIRVVPFGIDFDKYTPVGDTLLENVPTKYNFLSVGQWLQQGDRKNMLGVLRTFLNVFKGNKDVGLILKTYHESAGTRDKISIALSIETVIRDSGIPQDKIPQVYLIHGAMSEDSLIKLYRNANAFLLPTTGEAWGMPLLEAAAMNLPIITTSGSGSESFLNPEHTIFLDCEWKELGYSIHWPGVYEPQQRLAIPNMEEFARMINRIYKYQDLSKEKAIKQRTELVDRDFSWKHSAEVLTKTLQELDA